MAVDLTMRTCGSCSHASVCPNRDVFMKFFENRNALLCRTGGDSNGETGYIDTSKQVSIRVEHRYLNGPGLEKLYHDLGLMSGDWSPCLSATYSGCPFQRVWHHPFDAPIYAPFPHPAGYIEPLCQEARDIHGHRLQFHAPKSPGTINTYPTIPQVNNWWNCSSCLHHGECSDANDYARLGGTVYSVFGVEYKTFNIGDTVMTADIDTPATVLPGYSRSDRTPETFQVTGEDDVLILYYETEKKDPEKPVYQYLTLKEIEEKGLMHTAELFFNDKSFFYPSIDPTVNPDRKMDVYLDGVVCGPINRMNEDGTAACVTGDYIRLSKVNDEMALLYTNDGMAIDTKNLELIGAYAGKMLAIDDEAIEISGKYPVKPESIDKGNYRKFRVAEGDRIMIRYVLDPKYRLDLDTMRIMNYGIDLKLASNRITTTKAGKRYTEEILLVDCPNGDFVIQTALVNVDFFNDPANFVPINYIENWDSFQIGWNYHSTEVINDTVALTAWQPIAPRRWPEAMVHDDTPAYPTDLPQEDETQIVRPYFRLLGYTQDANKRYHYVPNVEVWPAHRATYPAFARFLKTETFKDSTYWAMWALQLQQLAIQMHGCFNDISEETVGPDISRVIDTYVSNYLVADDGTELPEFEMKETRGWEKAMVVLPYQPDIKTWFAENFVKTSHWPDNFEVKVIEIPIDIVKVQSYDAFNHELVSWTPLLRGFDADGNSRILNDEVVESTGLTRHFAVLVYPDKPYGCHVLYQSHLAMLVDVVQRKKTVTPNLIYDASYMPTSYPYRQPNPSEAKAYRLDGIFPEDAEKVQLAFDEEGAMHLVGDAAGYYELSRESIVSYQQAVTINTTYDNARIDETQEAEIASFGGANFEFEIPEGRSLKALAVNGVTMYSVADAMVDDKTIVTENYTAQLTLSKSKFIVTLTNVRIDVTVDVLMHMGDNGTVEGCSRCRPYVDVTPYSWIQWYPTCDNFTES